jgi:multidrug efflux pump
MNISRFFVDRPVFAAVLSILIFVVGAISIPLLPVSEYPDVVPPSVVVRTVYPGANPKVIAETVAVPLEEAISGVEDMMYFKSVAGSDGVLQLIVTFAPGTDPDDAAVRVQNRVAQALSRLPEDVRRQGVTTQKQSPVFLMVVHLSSVDGQHDPLYLRNYMRMQVEDDIARIPGVGDTVLFGGGDYAMRLWLDPDKVAARGLTAGDVLSAVREQNVQVSAGQLGAEPMPGGSDFLLPINAKGRLESVDEFRAIVLKTGANGEIVRLGDVARVELAAGDYTLRARLNGRPSAALGVFQAPGANALDIRDAVMRKMEDVRRRLPPGLEIVSVYDTTVFVRDSIRSVVATLLEATLLVVLVVILFLQTWRASIIPLIAVPVSVVGTFAALYLLGFTINTLTLFGLVLAIGIVVDDAIVVVENVERHIEHGATPLQAAHRAMKEVSGPIVAIAAVLCAVFVPMAFLSGVTGQFYRQFAVTIAISTVISAINSLTLSPALAALLLKPVDAHRDRVSRGIERLFGWLFRPFNRFFKRSSVGYERAVAAMLDRRGAVFLVYLLLLVCTMGMFRAVPAGFIPVQDKLTVLAGVRMPEGSSIERTDAVMKKMAEIALQVEGVVGEVAYPGLNPLQFTNTPNFGGAFYILRPFGERSRGAAEIVAELNRRFASIEEGFAFALMPAPIDLGNGSGWSLYIQDRDRLGYGALQTAVREFQGAVAQTPGMDFPISSYQANVPQLDADVDRVKAKAQGVSLTELFDTLQTYMGSAYVNDFNLFGRTWQVIAQADGAFRGSVEDIARLQTRNARGDMVPIGSMVSFSPGYGPDPVLRYNGFPAADLLGEADPRVLSSGQAMAQVADVAQRVLPAGMQIEWTDLSHLQAIQGNAALVVFPLAVLLAFLVLAALYESWTLPLAVVLIVPVSMLAALVGVWLTDGDNNVFVQVGLVVLIGLACKNAILIVEFARELEMQGRGTVESALEACRLRLRPIIMTSIAFIAGTVPLVLSTGAGAEVRSSTGITVLCGMLGVTLLGLFLTPMFYVGLRKASRRPLVRHERQANAQAEAAP